MKSLTIAAGLLCLGWQARGDAFTDLVSRYDVITTVAGTGAGATDGTNYWSASFEGGPAVNARLSRPHMAMADDAENIYIVDKDSHSVLKVTPDGTIHTVAGTHVAGFNGDGPAPATSLQLNVPNGLWVKGDGTFYILDTANARVRRVDTSGVMTTLITDTSAITGGRGLWVREEEGLIYYADNPNVKRWTPVHSIHVLNNKSFVDLGNLVAEPGTNTVIATDRGANRVYRIHADGSRDPIAGSGGTSASPDGTAALSAGLAGVRAVWLLPDGGYLLGTHEGSQVWYVDPQRLIHLFVDGAAGAHSGDGDYFRSPGKKIAEVRSVTVTPNGNILIVENDGGFVRLITNRSNQPPVITRSPASQAVSLGEEAHLTVAFRAAPPVLIQWRKDAQDILDATNATLDLFNLQLADAGAYTVFLSNRLGAASSDAAQLTVVEQPQPPQIIEPPSPHIAAVGSNVVFNVTASGTSLVYQWQRNGRSIPGASGSSFEITNVSTRAAGLYRVIITNILGRVVSPPARLTVVRPVVIRSGPKSQVVAEGKPVRFKVRLTGTRPFHYQWIFNQNPLPGATNATLFLPHAGITNNGDYSLFIQNPASAAQSTNATLTVTNPLPRATSL